MTQTWIAADNGGVRVTLQAKTGIDAARQYVSGGEWGITDETGWVNVRVWREGASGEEIDVEHHKITIDPEPPKCSADAHDWQSPHSIVGGIKENPGVWGHGGGLTMQEVCLHCGCGKLTDTWATDPEDGRQGLESVRYEPGKYERQIADRRMRLVSDAIDALDATEEEIAALHEILDVEGFGGREDEVTGADGATKLAESKLDWYRTVRVAE